MISTRYSFKLNQKTKWHNYQAVLHTTHQPIPPNRRPKKTTTIGSGIEIVTQQPLVRSYSNFKVRLN